jgi:sugar lactone lactonase YvrE/murein DD-endopeptidase MepM/ murein hydrolase activator NlpD
VIRKILALGGSFLCLSFACFGIYYLIYHRATEPKVLNSTVQTASPETPKPSAFALAPQVSEWGGEGVTGMLEGERTHARFADPFGLAIDVSGNLYVADAGDNNRIRKISREGVVTTFAGGKEGFADGAATAEFNTPSGLAVDALGNVYVADTGNNAIRKITPQGIVSTIAGNGKAGYRDGAASVAEFNGPIGVAVDHTGNVYVADTYNDRIRRITPAGQVSTLAGGNSPGYLDGPAGMALFDTPCALAVGVNGEVYVADTRNNAIRTVSSNGQVATLARTLSNDHAALWRRPIGLALASDGTLYIGEMGHGRIMQISPTGELYGLTGVDIDFPSGDDSALRFSQPVAIALDKDGALLVSDPVAFAIRKVALRPTNPIARADAHRAALDALPLTAPSDISTAKSIPFPWPLKPQNAAHEIVGTMGEVRGNDHGDSRDHFHAGIDIRANLGTPVLAVVNGKINDPLAAWGYGDLTEGLSINTMSYIHMRVGRNAKDAPLDPARFAIVTGQDDKPRVRVKRGTRFVVGDTLGTVNRMYHVHLEYSPVGAAVNPLMLGLNGFKDHLAPHIDSIQLFDQNGLLLTKKRDGRLLVPRNTSGLSIVVDAYDQMEGNEARRRLGLYKLGFQILLANGTPIAGFEQPQINLEFNQLPPDRDAVKIAYAMGSGETVHGSESTRFLYVATNLVKDGHAKTGVWHADELPSGAYLIRILAADFAGNLATTGRDLPITLE